MDANDVASQPARTEACHSRVQQALRDIDQLAYIRFASVYHSYEDIDTLKREVDRLMGQRQGTPE